MSSSIERRSDRGQAALLVVVVATVLLAATLSGLAALGRTAADRAHAQTAADAAALAALDGGRSAAADVAARNGAVLVSWRRGPGEDEVTVTVSVDGVTASARASDAP